MLLSLSIMRSSSFWRKMRQCPTQLHIHKLLIGTYNGCNDFVFGKESHEGIL